MQELEITSSYKWEPCRLTVKRQGDSLRWRITSKDPKAPGDIAVLTSASFGTEALSFLATDAAARFQKSTLDIGSVAAGSIDLLWSDDMLHVRQLMGNKLIRGVAIPLAETPALVEFLKKHLPRAAATASRLVPCFGL